MRSPKCKVTMIAITSNKTQLAIAMIAAFAFVTTIGTTTPVFATHVWNIVDYEWYIWSRTSSDGHLSYLNCGSGSQSDNCDLKIKTTSGVQGY